MSIPDDQNFESRADTGSWWAEYGLAISSKFRIRAHEAMNRLMNNHMKK